ncbi:MAG: hypothetical protein WC076_05965 [Terrimicrobiaceae bacterium]
MKNDFLARYDTNEKMTFHAAMRFARSFPAILACTAAAQPCD